MLNGAGVSRRGDGGHGGVDSMKSAESELLYYVSLCFNGHLGDIFNYKANLQEVEDLTEYDCGYQEVYHRQLKR